MFHVVNKPVRRLDAVEKVTGRAKFAADLNVGGQLHAHTVYTDRPCAQILDIDISAATALEGVVSVITAADIPGPNFMFGRFPVLAENKVRYIGDGLAVVAAETAKVAEQAAALIKVTYETMPGVFSLEEALAEDAPRVHSDCPDNLIENSHYPVRFGQVQEGLDAADVILEKTYHTQFADQAYIEPEAILAWPDPYRQGVEIHGSIQNPYSIRQNVADILELKVGQVKVVQSTIGGSFGGKDESVMLMAARCAILALKTGRPVKMVLSREASLLESCKRHAYRLQYKIGARSDGSLTAVENTIYAQGGAYNNKAMFANWRGSVHAAGPYRVPNVSTDVYGVYTNTIYGGAYRGFSAPQITFATEVLMDELAAELGMSPKALRLKNCLQSGDQIPTGQFLAPDKIAAPLSQMLEDMCRRVDFDRKWQHYPQVNRSAGQIKQGIGLACTFRGTGLGGEGIDTAGATVTIDKDGGVTIQSGLTEMGQGMRTAHAQIVAEALGISLDRIMFLNTDTAAVMDGGPTVASRGTLAGGNAMLIAAHKLLKRIHVMAAQMLGCDPQDLVSSDDVIHVAGHRDQTVSFEETIRACMMQEGHSLSAQGWYNPGPEDLNHATGQGNAYPSYIFGCIAAELRVDEATGKVDTERLTALYEVGRAINPQIVKGQLYGGLLQGLGFALMEELDEDHGLLTTRNFDNYLIPTVADMPEIDITLYETDPHVGPYGAKGVGEIGIELAAPAIANAVAHATGKRIRSLPLNLERVLLGKALKGGTQLCQT